MRERRLSVLLAEDHMQISFWFENKPFESASLLTTFFTIAVWLKEVMRELKGPWVIFPSCKIQSVTG